MNTNPEAPGASAGASKPDHVLRINELWFDRLADGSKTAEVRKHDRDYQIGDRVTFFADGDPVPGINMRPAAHRVIDARAVLDAVAPVIAARALREAMVTLRDQENADVEVALGGIDWVLGWLRERADRIEATP